jgi:hypothetical protein
LLAFATMASDVSLARPARTPVERDVIRIASGLVSELGTMPPSGTVVLDDSLDRDLAMCLQSRRGSGVPGHPHHDPRHARHLAD